MPTPEPLNDEQFQALKLILKMSERDQGTLFRGIPMQQLEQVQGALGGLLALIKSASKQTYLGTHYATLSPEERRSRLVELTPVERIELLEHLDRLGQHQQVLDIARILASTETHLLDHLED